MHQSIDMSNSKRRNRSICQKSTIIAANLIRASSFVLAKMALGSPQVNSGISRSTPAHSPVPGSVGGPTNMLYTEAEGPHVTSYVKEPEKGKGVDARAKKYIEKVRMKNRSDLSAQDYMANCIPPPPVRKSAAYYAYHP
ncbi:hypothetical protein FCM35_KLT02175 [Carex littledalei]|uniref:Uncharacterized protein n=1 Tax=Carex littledalei TaxID=544730 RepID=A0A833R344_9POAL|nr:hypothetical protein FCM35_KLT02175 [Carex littledalei]